MLLCIEYILGDTFTTDPDGKEAVSVITGEIVNRLEISGRTEDIRMTSTPRVDDDDKDPVGFIDDSKAVNVDDSMTLDNSPVKY